MTGAIGMTGAIATTGVGEGFCAQHAGTAADNKEKGRGMTKTMWAGLALAGVMAMAPGQAVLAQATTSEPAGAQSSMTDDQLLPMTVHEAWVASGRNEDRFYAMVAQLTALSAQKRGVTLPNTTEAGQKAGATFKEIARRDPDQLLYVVVDTMVRQFAAKSAKTATAGAAAAGAKSR